MAGTKYERQSFFQDGDLITDALFHNEFNALVNAFQYQSSGSTTGHQHDSSDQQGGNIYRIGDQNFHNKIEVGTDDNGVQNASDSITFYIDVGESAVPQVVFADGTILPATTNDVDLGSTTRKFKDLHLTQLKPEIISIADGSESTNNITLGSDADAKIFLDSTDNNVLKIKNTSGAMEAEASALQGRSVGSTNAYFSASDTGFAFYRGGNPSLYAISDLLGVVCSEHLSVAPNKQISIGTASNAYELAMFNASNVSHITSSTDSLQLTSPTSVVTTVDGNNRVTANTTGVNLTGVFGVTGNSILTGDLSVIGTATISQALTANSDLSVVGNANINGELTFNKLPTETGNAGYSTIENNVTSNRLDVRAGSDLGLYAKGTQKQVKIYHDSTNTVNFDANYIESQKPLALTATNKLLLGTLDTSTVTGSSEIGFDSGILLVENKFSGGLIKLQSPGGLKVVRNGVDVIDYSDSQGRGLFKTNIFTKDIVVNASNTNQSPIGGTVDGVATNGQFTVLGQGSQTGNFTVSSPLTSTDMYLGSSYLNTGLQFFTKNPTSNNLHTSLHIEADGHISMYAHGNNQATKFEWTDKVRVSTTNTTPLTVHQTSPGLSSKIGFESSGATATIGNTGVGNLELKPYAAKDIIFSGDSGDGLIFKGDNNYVGVGIADPDFKFHVHNGSSKLNNIVIGDSNAARAVIHGTPSAGMTLDVDSNAWITFTEGEEEVMRVGSNSKRVGIGVETPLERLDVSGNIKVSGTLKVDDEYSLPTADGTNTQVLTTDGSGNLYWGTGVATGSNTSQWTTSASDIFYSTGGVTIGSTATPAQKLDVHGQTTTTGLDLKAIAETKSVTASDVFVYDTSKDSDGGAWRHRTQGTSWYNEDLNTSTRGATKKFPAVAVIVLTGSKTGSNPENKVTIYDADDPSMPMWMEFAQVPSTADMLGRRGVSSIAMKDGLLCVTANDTDNSGGFTPFIRINFISDVVKHTNHVGTHTFPNVIADRASATYIMSSTTDPTYWKSTEGAIVDPTQNDVAVTVLPNAPIDPDTGLPVPTIAVATEGGVSIIKDDGSVVDITGQVSGPKLIQFNNNNEIVTQENYHERLVVFPIPEEDVSTNNVIGARKYERHGNDGVRLSHWSVWNSIVDCETNKIALGCSKGLNQLHENPRNKHTGIINYITSDYNTGWMLGHTRLATLMDTTAETINATELITNGDFSSFGSNLITNGEFPNNADGWTTNGGDWEWDSSGRIERVAGSVNSATTQNINIVDGKTYRVRYDVVHSSGDTQSNCFIDTGSGNITIGTLHGSGSVDTFFTAQATTTMQFRIYGINDWRGFIDNVRVEQVTGWTASGNASLSINSGALRITTVTGGQTAYATTPLSLEVGKTYKYSVDNINTQGTGGMYLYLGSSAGSGSNVNVNIMSQAGTTTGTFVATHATTILTLLSGSSNQTGQYKEFDNVSVVEVVADRSVNANGINIIGNVTKDAVATGAELVGYGGMSTSNRLVQSYNSDLDFGTGDFSIMAWVKTNSLSSQYILDRSNRTDNTNRLNFLIGSTNSNLFTRIGVTTCTVDYDFEEGLWYCVAVCRRQGVLYFYVNGKLIGTKENTQSNTGNFETTIAGYNATGAQSPDRTALLRISATAPTAEQIAKIYRDERPLFQEGAKCTLVTTDNVNTIAYDEDTELLHVGNSSSTDSTRDVFSGLQRVESIDQGTQHTNTAISASNDLVVEE